MSPLSLKHILGDISQVREASGLEGGPKDLISRAKFGK